ncbi:MAG: NAD(P)H-dependent glycerol-3-phosphate dehydrogenase [Bacteroidota bacterium]
MNNLKVGILGGGSWGTTVGSLTSRNADTLLWARNPDTVDEINSSHSNTKYLPDAKLTSTLQARYTIAETVHGADVVVMAIPSNNFRDVLAQAREHIRPWVPIVSLTKGLEHGTKMRMTQVIESELPGHPVAALTGPNLAREIIAGYAAASVVATADTTIANALQKLFRTGLFRVYTNKDVIGCEIGGALKNVIAIAAGMGDGVGAGENTRSAVITRGLAELTRLGKAMGGKSATFAGLAGMGDLVATCSSSQSRNRTVGYHLGKGMALNDIIDQMSMVAEGVKTCAVVRELADDYGIDMPIAEEVYKVVHQGNTAYDAFKGLLKYESKSEKDPG